MVKSQLWLEEGAKGLWSPKREKRFAPVQNGILTLQNWFRMVPKDSWDSFVNTLGSPRTFGLQNEGTPH